MKNSTTENLTKHLSLLMREKVPIPSALGLGLMPHELVDEPLIHAFRREVGSEGMPQNVPSS